VDYKGLVTDRS